MLGSTVVCSTLKLVPSVISHQYENHISCPHHMVMFYSDKMAGKDMSQECAVIKFVVNKEIHASDTHA
jgi:hypothetical protein